MRQRIEQLKQRPEEERVAIAAGFAIAVGVVLFFGWAFFFITDFSSEERVGTDERTEQQAFNLAAFEEAAASLRDSYNDASDRVRAIQADLEAQRATFEAQATTTNE